MVRMRLKYGNKGDNYLTKFMVSMLSKGDMSMLTRVTLAWFKYGNKYVWLKYAN